MRKTTRLGNEKTVQALHCDLCAMDYLTTGEDSRLHDKVHKKAEVALQSGKIFLTETEWQHLRAHYGPILIAGKSPYSFEERYDAALKVLQYLFHQSMVNCRFNPKHVGLNAYIAMFLKANPQNSSWFITSPDVYQALVEKFSTRAGIKHGSSQYEP